jgi:replication initiation and membrane attachment protein DnaB
VKLVAKKYQKIDFVINLVLEYGLEKTEMILKARYVFFAIKKDYLTDI